MDNAHEKRYREEEAKKNNAHEKEYLRKEISIVRDGKEGEPSIKQLEGMVKDTNLSGTSRSVIENAIKVRKAKLLELESRLK